MTGSTQTPVDEHAAQTADTNLMPEPKLFTKDFIFISAINLCLFFGFQMTLYGMPLYIAELGGEGVFIGLSTTVNTIAAVALRPISGYMLDRFGRKGVLLVGIGLMLGAFIAFSLFPIIGVVLALRAVQGIGWGLSSTATSTLAADIVPRARFAEGIGYYSLTASLSSAVAPALGIQLIHDFGVHAMLIAAAITAALGFVMSSILDVKRIMQESDSHADNPDPMADEKPKPKAIALSDMFDRRALIPAIAMVLLNIGYTAVGTFIVLHAQTRGVDNVSLYFLVYAVTTLVTRPLTGRIVDKSGFFWPGILSALGIAATLVTVAVANNVVVFCIAGVFGGIGIGTSMNVFQAMSVAAVPPQRRGVATSTYMLGLDLGVALGGLIGGLLVTPLGYVNMFFVMTLFPLSVVGMFFVLGKKRIAQFNYT